MGIGHKTTMRRRGAQLAAAATLLIGVSGPARSADATGDGMYVVGEDADYAWYLVDAFTITTPGEGYRKATVYRTTINHAMGVYNGNLQSWEFRCKPLGVKLLSDHDYQKFEDGTWGDADGPPASTDFIPMKTTQAMGVVAKFACLWPKVPKTAAVLTVSLPDDPKERLEYLLMNLPDK